MNIYRKGEVITCFAIIPVPYSLGLHIKQ